MSRLTRLIAVLAMLFASTVGAGFVAAQGTPQPAAAASGQLVVADPVAEALYIYDLGTHEIVATFSQTVVNDHAGFLALPDGRLLYVDVKTSELVAIQLDAEGGPAIAGRVPVPGPVSHVAVDPAVTYAAVGASDELRPLTLIDLRSYTSRSFDVAAGEVGLALGGAPLTFYHRNDALKQIEAYPVAQIQKSSYTPTGVVDTGALGHGEAISHDLSRLYTATDDGIDALDLVEDDLTYHATLPWDASGRTGGRGYFVRLSAEGRHLFSYVANREAEETSWDEWTNDAYIADLETDEVTRGELGPGLVYRFALSATYALFFNVHPTGDNAHLLDVDPASPTFGAVVATIPLDPLTNAPQAGESPWEAQSRITAITPDGARGFVSHGGDGIISVIDTATRQVVGTIEVPSSLSGGGYMIAIQPGMPFADTIGR